MLEHRKFGMKYGTVAKTQTFLGKTKSVQVINEILNTSFKVICQARALIQSLIFYVQWLLGNKKFNMHDKKKQTVCG